MRFFLKGVIFFSLLMTNLLYGLSNVFLAPKNFIGRQSDIQELSTLLKKKRSVAITGCLGLGKTQFARKFVQEKEQQYEITWWIDSERGLVGQFRELGNLLLISYPQKCLNKKILDNNPVFFVKSFFKNTELKWLLIFDNFFSESELREYICDSENGHTLFTSRNNIGWSHVYNLDFLPRNDSIKLIMKLAAVNKPDATQLNKYLSGYPLIITQACMYFRALSSITIKDFIDSYLKREDSKKNGLQDIFQKQIDDSIEAVKIESLAAFYLIKVISLLNSKSVPECIIRSLLEEKFPDQYEKAISIIRNKYSLVSLDHYDKKTSFRYNDPSYSIHDSIQEAIRNKISKEEKTVILNEILKKFHTFFMKQREVLYKILSENRNIYNHARFFSDKYQSIIDNKAFHLYFKLKIIDYTMRGLRNYALGKKMIGDFEKQIENQRPISIDTRVLYYINKSNFYIWRHNSSKALGYIEMAMNLLKGASASSNRIDELITLYIYKSYIQIHRGEFHKAEKTLNQSLSIKKNGFGENDTYLKSLYYYSKAWILYDQGKLNEALVKAKKSISISEESATYYNVYFHRKRLILKILNELGFYTEQISENIKFEKEYLTHSIPPNHEAFAGLYMERAIGEMNLSNYKSAFQYIDKAIQLLKDWHQKPNERRYQAEVYQIKADLLYKINKFDEASNFYRMAWDIYSTIMVEYKSYPLIKLFVMWAKSSILTKNDVEYNENIKRLKKYRVKSKESLLEIYDLEASTIKNLKI